MNIRMSCRWDNDTASLSFFFSGVRKFEQKVTKFLKNPKDLLQSNFKISKDLHQRPPESQKYLNQCSKNDAKTGFNRFFFTAFEK